MSDGVFLDDLPYEHPARNLPLGEIGAQYQLTTKGQIWHKVRESMPIAKVTYNQLGEVWILYHVWKAVNYTGEKK